MRVVGVALEVVACVEVVASGVLLVPHPDASSAAAARTEQARSGRVTGASLHAPPVTCDRLYSVGVSVIAVVLLAAAVALIAAAEWPRLSQRVGADAWQGRKRARRKSQLRVVPDDPDESDDFVRSVERDLAELPTIDPRDVKR